MRSETPIAEAKRRGVPLKWVYRWDERGTVTGSIEGHPNQYLVRKASTGQEIKRSGATLSHTTPPEEVVGQVKEVRSNPAFHDLSSTFFGDLNLEEC